MIELIEDNQISAREISEREAMLAIQARHRSACTALGIVSSCCFLMRSGKDYDITMTLPMVISAVIRACPFENKKQIVGVTCSYPGCTTLPKMLSL